MITYLPAGRRGALVELAASSGIDPAAFAATVRRAARELGIVPEEVVPGAQTVLLQASTADELHRLLAAIPDHPDVGDTGDLGGTATQPAMVELQVRYDGPDLAAVADATGLTVAEVIQRHSAVTYRAAFSGFAPGFAYLTGLDPELRLPRLETPRTVVPAGSVAIAESYTAVYPNRSPGGWHLLGTVQVAMFDVRRRPPALISPGQTVRFVAADTTD